MPHSFFHWLGADAERIREAHLIEQAERDAEAMRHLAEQIEE